MACQSVSAFSMKWSPWIPCGTVGHQISQVFRVAMLQWFAGNALALEMQRCVQEMLTVCQARPDADQEGDANAQDLYEDENYEVQAETLQRALQTHVRNNEEPDDRGNDKDGESKAIDRGRQAWRVEERGDNENQGDGAVQDDEGVAAMINAAKKIEKNNEEACPNNDVVREADCKLVTLKNPDQIRAWFVNKRHEKTESGKPLYNEKQLQVICKVVNRICEEMEDKAHVTEPLLWCMHGGPGVGKSHVLKGLKELFEFVGYQNNVHYVMTALQAVMAEQLEGDTLHHATGLVPKQFKKIPKFETGATKRQQEVSKLLEHCRWFIIDEISMVSV